MECTGGTTPTAPNPNTNGTTTGSPGNKPPKNS